MVRDKVSNPVVKGALARGASLLPAAVATLAATRLVLDNYDESVFNGYTLVFSTMVMIPLNTLGAGTAVTTTFAAEGPSTARSAQVLLTAARVMVLSALGLSFVSLLLAVLGAWPDVLGPGAEAGGAFGLAMCLYAVTFVPGLGQNVLLAADKNHLSIIVQAFLAPGMLTGVALAVWFDAPRQWIILVPGFTVFAIAMVNAWVCSRATEVRWRQLLADIPRVRSRPGTKIRSLAGPALIVNVTGPILLQSDRLVLSHFSTERALTNYSIAVQLFAPVLAVVVAAAQPLWPMFTKHRADGTRPPSLLRVIGVFIGFASLAAVPLSLASGPLSRIIGGEGTDLGILLPAAMAVVVLAQAALLPLGMALKDEAGLRLAAKCGLTAVPLNLGLSMALAGPLGAGGPLVATIIVGCFVHLVPMTLHYRRRAQAVEVADEPLATQAPPSIPTL